MHGRLTRRCTGRAKGRRAGERPVVGHRAEGDKLRMADMVKIGEIAKRLAVDSTTVRRLIAKESEALQLQLHRGKSDRLLLSRDDADKLIATYEARRGPVATSPEEAAKYDRYGYFYLVQLVPEALPNRVKIGFADNVEKRLTEHRTAAPTAKLLEAWP